MKEAEQADGQSKRNIIRDAENADVQNRQNETGSKLFVDTFPSLFPKVDGSGDKIITRSELSNAVSNGFRNETPTEHQALQILQRNYKLFAQVSGINNCTGGDGNACNGPSSGITMRGFRELEPAILGRENFKTTLLRNPPGGRPEAMALALVGSLAGTLAGIWFGSKYGFGAGMLGGAAGMVLPMVGIHYGERFLLRQQIDRRYDREWAPEVRKLQDDLNRLRTQPGH